MAEEAKTTEKAAPKEKAPKDLSHGTPSGLAALEAGDLADDASDEEKVAWHSKYLEAKLKARRG